MLSSTPRTGTRAVRGVVVVVDWIVACTPFPILSPLLITTTQSECKLYIDK